MAPAATTAVKEPQLPKINEITFDHPWKWLAMGWKDLTRSLPFSLAYGSVYVVVSYLLTFGLVYGDLFFIIPPLVPGFFLVAPVLGIGFYQMSRSLERGEEVQFCNAINAWKRNEVHLSAMAIVLVLVVLVWMLAALLSFALFYNQPVPTWGNFIPDLFLSVKSPGFLFSGIVIGGSIATFAFSIAAVSVPMLMDRQVDVMTAMRTSVRAVRKNWQPMALWACLIVMFVGAGIVTFFIGLIVWMPLVGHATWHAYRDLVQADDGEEPSA